MDSRNYRQQRHHKDDRVVNDTVFSANDLVNIVNLLSTGPVFVFALIGSAAMWFRKERNRENILLWGIIFSFAIVYSLFAGRTRYRIPIEPYLMVFCALAYTEPGTCYYPI